MADLKPGDTLPMDLKPGDTLPVPPPAPAPQPRIIRAPPGMAANVGDHIPDKKGVFGVLGDEAKAIGSSVVGALGNRSAQSAAGKKEAASRYADIPWYRPDQRVGRFAVNTAKGVADETSQAYHDYQKSFKRPEDANLTAPAALLTQGGRGVAGALNLIFSPITGAAKGSGLATDIQSATGLSKDASAGLVAGAVPVSRLAGLGKEGGALAKAGRGISDYGRKVLAPGTVDEGARDTATIHRMAIGGRRAEADAEMHALNSRKLQSVVGNAPGGDQDLIAKYIDTRSTGSIKLPEKYQAAANQMRDTYSRYRSRIENVFGDSEDGGPTFIKDYYARLWKNPPKDVQASLQRSGYGGGVQGSGRSLRARVIPTYEEGLKAGLTPVFRNPLDATRAYVDNMASFLATHDIRNAMVEKGMAKWVPENGIPSDWKKLDGIKTTRDRTFIMNAKPTNRREVLAAPENSARVYNNHVSQGLAGGLTGPIYEGARKAANTLTQAKLSLSAFHAMTMGQEGIVSGVKDALKAASRGDVKTAGKELLKAPVAPITKAVKGDALRKAILDPDIAHGMDPKIVDAYTKAGGRATMDRFYSSQTGSRDFLESLKRGTFKRDLTDSLKEVAGAEGVMGKAGKSIGLAARAVETGMAPLFKEYIPRVKAGAFADEMGQWYRLNPEASSTEAQRAAEKIVDSIDNRFGEMITDNQFWHRQMHQLGQLLLLSPSWDIGTARLAKGAASELGESARGLMGGKGITDNTAYAAALVGTTAVMNGIYTRLATGEEPSGRDYFAARTGGTDLKGQPERTIMPGYMKDVLGFYNQPQTTFEDKANPALSAALEAWSNKDYFGRPIVRPKGVAPITDTARAGLDRPVDAAKWLMDQAAPISLESKGAPNPESHIGPLGHFLGMKQAPAYLEDPNAVAHNVQKFEGRDWKAKMRSDAKREAQSEAPAAPSDGLKPGDSFPGALAPGDTLPGFNPSGPAIKPGATAGGDIRPEFKPIADYITTLDGFKEITAENDLYHPASDVHGQGKAMDFTIKGGKKNAADFVAQLRRNLKAQGFSARVMDEYNFPSRNATGGHIHVSLS